MIDDGRLLALGALGALLVGGAVRGSRSTSGFQPSSALAKRVDDAVRAADAAPDGNPREQFERYKTASRLLNQAQSALLDEFLAALEKLPSAMRKQEHKAENANRHTSFNRSFFQTKQTLDDAHERLNA